MLEEIIKRNRSYRRFDSNHKITESDLLKIIDNARFTASARNQQILKFKIIADKSGCDKIFPHLKWAGYLKDWSGPNERERPTAYIIICADKSLIDNNINNWIYTDLGITAQTIMLQLAEKELGGCMIAAFNKTEISKPLNFSDEIEILLVLAIGKPAEKVTIVEKENLDDIKYWREEDVHYVPKRALKDVILV